MSSPLGRGDSLRGILAQSSTRSTPIPAGSSPFSYKRGEWREWGGGMVDTGLFACYYIHPTGCFSLGRLPSWELAHFLEKPSLGVSAGGCMLSHQPASNLQPLCYEHHTEMTLVQIDSANGATVTAEPRYACPVSDCPVCYTSAAGYFLATRDRDQVENEILPRVRCPQDAAPMYLAEVRPQERSFRLWRCPLCQAVSTSGQTLVAAT